MFTGIIKSLGSISSIIKEKNLIKLEINVSKDIFIMTNIGDSVAINGVCLTAVKKNNKKKILFFDVVGETLNKTNFNYFKNSDNVNLETPLKLSDGLDGHIVQGHVDTTGTILKNEHSNDDWLLEVKIDKKWIKYCILKGSIAIDGISLTIAKINNSYDDSYGSVTMSIIPHTLKNTNLQFKNKKDTVNIETDFFAKYIEKLLPKKD